MASSLPRSFQGFASVFGQATAEPDSSTVPPQRPFIFRARSLDAFRLEVVASDFASRTFLRVFTVEELEDMRDDVGLGGTWEEFVDYVSKSLDSDAVKFSFSDGGRTAKLIAHKSKGMPRIIFVLNRLVDSLAGDVVAELSMSLYSAFKNRDNDAAKAHARCQYLTGLLSSEKEKTKNLQRQLDSFTFKSKRKAPKGKDLKREISGTSVIDMQNNCDTVQASEVSISHASQPTKAGHKAVPVRRVKARGARLQDTEENVDS